MSEAEYIATIRDQIDRFSNGNFSELLNVSGRNEEIDRVAMALNLLGRRLQIWREHGIAIGQSTDIDDHQGTLERHIQQRTKELQESEFKYRNLFENNPVSLWILELPSLKFIDVNESAIQQYGYSREEFLSMTATDIRPEGEKAQFLSINRSIRGTQNRGTWKHLKKDGTTMYAEVIVHEIIYNGKPARFVLSTDVTERQLMQEEIMKLNKTLEERVAERTSELVRANKELESFSYSVSHDLRAPIRAINGYSEMLLEDHGDRLNAEALRLINTIKSNAKKMGQLVDDLLTFSKLGKRDLDRIEIDLDDLVRTVLQDLEFMLDERMSVQVESLGTAFADRGLLYHVFQNLILNAIKYTSKKANPIIIIGTTLTDKGKTYFVRDNGVGFNMAYYNKLFGIFQRLHHEDEFEGNGVGLAMVQRIIERHGGKVWAEGYVGQGASFFFTIESAKEI
jgi:PAS domain S-box-containing protein